jgi:hypothetical protein
VPFKARTKSSGSERNPVELIEIYELVISRFWTTIKEFHIGSCSALRCASERIETFLESTRVAAVTEYERQVDWMESAAFELLYYSTWTGYVNASAFRAHMLKAYGQLAERLGFACYFRR